MRPFDPFNTKTLDSALEEAKKTTPMRRTRKFSTLSNGDNAEDLRKPNSINLENSSYDFFTELTENNAQTTQNPSEMSSSKRRKTSSPPNAISANTQPTPLSPEQNTPNKTF